MKYIIDVPDNTTWIQVSTDRLEPYTEPDLSPLVDEAVETIENEVWSLAREIAYCMSLNECEDAGMLCDDDIYDSATGVLEKLSYQEAKTKYEAWKKQKDEIRVGDEVYSKTSKWRGVVTDIDDGDLTILDGSGQTACHYNPKHFGKTGKHFDSIKNLLDGLKED